MNLKIELVSKKYKKDFWGLKDFSLEINSGILGLVGPNGAGKSTLMRIISTITKPTSGSIFWCGDDVAKNPKNLKNDLGYLPQDFGVYPNLSSLEFLKYIAAIKGVESNTANKRIEELLQSLNLYEKRNTQLGSLSGGMKQRVGIAQALINDPKLLIVDEPTVGLDPEERIRFRNLLSNFSDDRIVILSSHIISDIESTATSIALMKNGKLIVHSNADDLLNSIKNKVWEISVDDEELDKIKKDYLISSTNRKNGKNLLRIISDSKPFESSKNIEANLEDVYLYNISSFKIN